MNLPEHIAIIMDGNGRWAKKRLLPRNIGHWFGFKKARAIVFHGAKIGVPHMTLFAFGRENWQRPEKEVSGLMNLLLEQIDKVCKDLLERNIKARFLGDRTRISIALMEKISQVEKLTEKNTGLFLNVAIDYSGQFDIVNAVNKIIQEKRTAPISEEEFAKYLLTDPNPSVDLLIRTSGEYRLSNFLLYQIAYAELYFSNKMWPSFGPKELDGAIEWFNTKERRFGKTSEQLEK